jgi:hypothetical protein
MLLFQKLPQAIRTLSMSAVALSALVVVAMPGDAEAQRSARPASRDASRASQVYVPGHWTWDRRRNEYVWVPGRWERNQRGEAFVGARWTFRNGRWEFNPGR